MTLPVRRRVTHSTLTLTVQVGKATLPVAGQSQNPECCIMTSRWSVLRDLATEGDSPDEVYYRWIDLLDQPINAREFVRGDDTVVLWEDANGRWVVEGVSKAVYREPRKYFDTEPLAIVSLEAEQYTFQRTVPAYKRPRIADSRARGRRWFAWGVFVLLLVVICAGLVGIVYMLVTNLSVDGGAGVSGAGGSSRAYASPA